jgi:splicing factor 3B subunit 2
MPPRRTRASQRNADNAAAASEVVAEPTQEEQVVDVTNGIAQSTAAEAPTEPPADTTQVNGKQNKSAAQKKREKRKQKKREGSVVSDTESVHPPLHRLATQSNALVQVASSVTVAGPNDVDTVSERSMSLLDTIDTDIDTDDPAYAAFRKVFNRFDTDDGQDGNVTKDAPGKGEIYYSDDDDVPMDEDEESGPTGPVSKKKARKANRPSVAFLKQLVDHPEIVEWTDATAADPELLVHLRGYRNMIPVPSHWGQKRDYLASKRGVAKQPYELPHFIRDTGIQEMRNPFEAQTQSLRSKMRERVQGKTGKLDVDYQKLHDAFFRYQTKPQLSRYGEVYYEGKEFETNFQHKRPGEISNELKEALNIPPGAPPPWLINMQRFGPPPSFPNLKIPGLNAPIPAGAKWGFHPGGWGKPPVDEYNRPLYGDVFGVMEKTAPAADATPVQRDLWGTIEEAEQEVDDEESEEDVEDEEDEGEEGMDMDGIPTNETFEPSGLETPSGLASAVPSGLETPEFLELRKSRFDQPPEPSSEPRDLYRVLPETRKGKGLMGNQAYDISRPTLDQDPVTNVHHPHKGLANVWQKKGVDVALDPSQLENLTKADLRALHDQEELRQQTAKRGYNQEEGLSDMVAEHAAIQAKKRKTQEEKKQKSKFKF